MILYYYYLSKTASALEPRSGEVYSIQHYVIKFVSDLRQIGGFNPSTPVSSTYMYNTDRHDITEINDHEGKKLYHKTDFLLSSTGYCIHGT
jgi:hypothetical protein